MPKIDFRDVSGILQKFREFCLGRKHHLGNLHARLAPFVSPRTLPTPEIQRGPCSINKYYDQWYCDRNARDGVKPPVVAPLGEGPAYPLDCTKEPQPTNLKPHDVKFATPPRPGQTWWWDGHSYYESVPDRRPKPVSQPCPKC